MTTSSSERLDVYTAITNQIIAAIDAGADNPKMPWHCAGGVIERPVNVASGKTYRGVNTVALWASAFSQQFQTGLWGTYRQWSDKGAQVRKGEKSSLIVFYKDLTSRADDDADAGGDDDDRRRSHFMARASRVFNVAQVDGYTLPVVDTDADPIAPCDHAEQLVASSGAKIIVGGMSAHYDRRADHIAMPDRFRFTGTATITASEGWYATLLHELTHWSGAEHRLARTFGERFGDDAYAMEDMWPSWARRFSAAISVSPSNLAPTMPTISAIGCAS